eukprot:486880-Pelagomonas_calceolata.AAC.1
MDIMLTGDNQSQADQPNSLDEVPTILICGVAVAGTECSLFPPCTLLLFSGYWELGLQGPSWHSFQQTTYYISSSTVVALHPQALAVHHAIETS